MEKQGIVMKLCSIDSSTKATGISFFIDGKYQSHTLFDHHKTKDVNERINSMIKDITKLLQKENPDIVWIEHPQGHGKNVSMVAKLSEILGAVRCWCVCKNKEYYEINPSQWRKWLPEYSQGGKSRTELKADSIAYVQKHLGIDASEDECDSLCIGLGVLEYYKSLE